MLLGLQAAPLGREGGFRRAAVLGLPGSFPDQFHQSVDGVPAVSFLRPEPARRDDEHPVGRHPPPRQARQALADVFGQGGGARHVEAELHGGGDLVDVLAARPGGAYEVETDLALPDSDGSGDSDHAFLTLKGLLFDKGLIVSSCLRDQTAIVYYYRPFVEI